jgi:hypothetical protein
MVAVNARVMLRIANAKNTPTDALHARDTHLSKWSALGINFSSLRNLKSLPALNTEAEANQDASDTGRNRTTRLGMLRMVTAKSYLFHPLEK